MTNKLLLKITIYILAAAVIGIYTVSELKNRRTDKTSCTCRITKPDAD